MKKMLKFALWGVVVILAAIQFVPVDRTNPPSDGVAVAPAAAQAVLERACYDCHSHETVWPWYSRIAPASWLIAKDVREGRDHLNFSTWDALPAGKRAHKLEEVREETSEGKMPLKNYLLLHPEAKLSDADLAALRDWTGADGSGHEPESGDDR